MSFTITVPGKLMLCGEYAVVRGTPALCAAVARHATATFEAGPPSGGMFLRAMGHGPLRVRPDQPLPTLEPSPADPAPWALVRHVLAQHPRLPDGTITLDTSTMAQAPVHGGAPIKLGVGSSAAAAVALCAALDQAVHGGAVDDARRRQWFVTAQRAHLAAQGGVGSGVDVATSALGGVVLYRRPDASPEHAVLERVDPSRLGVVLRVVWTGVGVSTAALLRQVDAWCAREPAASQALFAHMGRTAAAATAAVRAADTQALLHSLDVYGDAMAQLGQSSGADIVTAAHAQVRQVARAHGCVAKPSGAGGGDVAVVAAPDEDRARAAETALRAQGLTVVDLPLWPHGADVVPPRS